jgi:hypothetical protein
LTQNRGTLFGRKYEFAKLRSVADYQKAVPLTRYDDYLPYVDRLVEGQQRVLTEEPVTHFALSSGSTSPAKHVPYTRSLQAEFRRAIAPWICDVFKAQPSLLLRTAYWSITPLVRPSGETRGGIRVGFEEDSAYLGQFFKALVNATLAVPGEVRQIQDLEQFRQATVVSLLGRRDLGLISVWHPSFLLLLLDWIEDHWDEVLSDLRQGLRLGRYSIDISPQPNRARELEVIGPENLAAIWPDLKLISCWGDGHAGEYIGELAERFPQVEIQSKGLLATEAFVTLPFRGTKPLAVCSHFFEFLTPEGGVRNAWQLDRGSIYEVVVTTGGGLYRYRLDDRVEVTGFLNGVPCLRFISKGNTVSDLFGEKLSEDFVAGAIRHVTSMFDFHPRFAMLAPDVRDEGSCYTLFLETTEDVPPSLCISLDDALRANPHYDYCIRLGQLTPVRARKLQRNAYEKYVRHLTGRTQRLGDIKPVALSPLLEWPDIFASVNGS